MSLAAENAQKRPLSQYTVFESGDLDETRDLVSRIFCPHRLEIKSRNGRLDACHHHAPLSGVSLNYIQYGADVLIDPGELENFFLIQMPLSGHARIRCGKQTLTGGPGLCSVASPTEYLHMNWSADCKKLIVKIDRDPMERHVANLLGRSIQNPLVFDLSMNLRSRRGGSWWRCVRFLREELENELPAWAGSPVAHQFEEMLMTLLLFSQPNNYSDQLHAPATPAAPRHVKLAQDYIRENAGEAVTIDDLVRETGVSARTLYAGFRRFRGTSPMNYLRDVRMENARRELLCSKPGQTVTAIATRWHFYQLGRFADKYRKRYGEAPSQTLRR